MHCSQFYKLNCFVPQGSILGLLLFFFFIYFFDLLLLADDKIVEAVGIIESELKLLMPNLKELCSFFKLSSIDSLFCCNPRDITFEPFHNYFWVKLDNKFAFHTHINHVKKK